MDDPDWPDFIDVYTGVFTYFGDNKKPGSELHDTPRRGNRLLQSRFAILHNAPDKRIQIPPFLVFTKGTRGRDVIFRGHGMAIAPKFLIRLLADEGSRHENAELAMPQPRDQS
jgi:hypothetical protein